MSEGLGITTETTVFLSVDKLVAQMDIEDIGSFCSAVALRLDREYRLRNNAAEQFASGLSEMGCRFVAEAVTQHFMRTPR